MDFTNRGRRLLNDVFFRSLNAPTGFYVALITSLPQPTADTKTMADLNQIAAGNGYTSGGVSVSRNSVDFDSITEDDLQNRSSIFIKDVVWTASGGNLPASGSGARFAVLTTAEATVSARQILAWWDLTGPITKESGASLTLFDLELRIIEVV